MPDSIAVRRASPERSRRTAMSDMNSAGPLDLYRARRTEGRIKPDPAQALAAEKLQSLHNALVHYQPDVRSGGRLSWLERLGLARRQDDAPQGLYIFGAVGRGKSMLMDLFFESTPIAHKRRVHFLAFMLEVHDALHRLRQDKAEEGDALLRVADEIAATAWLLCFDEFQVTNIADAMLLGRLFESLFERGVVVVATSNWAPDQLYEGGLQRDRFLPFIALVKQRLDILELDGDTDYRLARLADLEVYHAPSGSAATAALEAAFAALTDGAMPAPDTLTAQGRTIRVPRAARGVAWFGFADLCAKPLGPADFLAIATHFHTVFVTDVPLLTPDLHNETRRFVTLVDALYEHRAALVVSAADAPDRLCAEGDAAFEFRRTASRLAEMRSSAYRRRPHLT
jgi:cell division protein ZapE